MSKTNLRRPPKKAPVRKRQDWDSTIGDLSQHRLSDDETNRRKHAYQSKNLSLIQEEKQRKLLAKVVHDARKNNSNQLGILREILFNERDVDELMQRSNHVLQSSRSEKFVPKSSVLRSGKNHFTSLSDNPGRKSSASSTRPSSARNLNSPGGADWNQSEDDHLSASSAEGDDDELENEPVRLSRSTKKADHRPASASILHSLNERHANLYAHSRPSSNGLRSTNDVSSLSDVPRHGTKANGVDSGSSSNQLKTLLDRLALELNELESFTGFKADKHHSSAHQPSNTCSTALVTALLTLTGHVKRCAVTSKGQCHPETNTLKEQLAVVIKAQLDFQQKIENQVSMLQTMMQTVCQLVNNELISNKKTPNGAHHAPEQPSGLNSSRAHTTSSTAEARQQYWLSHPSVQKQSLPTRANTVDELQAPPSRINHETHQHRLTGAQPEEPKKVSRPTFAVSSNDNHSYDMSKLLASRRTLDPESRSTMISPIEPPTSYDMFESGLPKSQSIRSMFRGGANTTGPNAPPSSSSSSNETILEKILQERLILVQQIAELNKQHEMTQEELAHLEANTTNQRSS